jgi:hypothetical protein
VAKRRKTATAYIYNDGIVYGWVGRIPKPDAPLLNQAMAVVPSWSTNYREQAVLHVTSNGKVWSYVVRPLVVIIPGSTSEQADIKYAASYVPKDSKHSSAPPLANLEAAYRAPFEWAKRDMAKRAKLPGDNPNALMFGCAYEQEAPQDAVIRLPGPCGPITYTGITRKVGAYTLEALHAILVKSVADCIAVWTWRSAGNPAWKPTGLEVMLHDGRRALGLAFAPGSGRETNKRTISLNKVLLEKYDAHSIWRVVVHEICHHYRDEAFGGNEVEPAERDTLLQTVKAHIAAQSLGHRAVAQWEQVLRTHDATFVRELGRVDPKITENLITGMVFTEYVDQSLVAELAAKRAARKVKPVSWSPSDGRIYMDRLKSTGRFSVWWLPLTTGAWKAAREGLNNPQMRQMIARLGPEWASTKVTYSGTWPSSWSAPDTLGGLAPLLEHNLGMFLGEIKKP